MTSESPSGPAALILGAAPRISVPIARALNQHGIRVDVASFQSEEAHLSSRAIRHFHRLPPRGEDQTFSQALLGLVGERGYDTIVATGDPSLAALADFYHELQPLVRVGCPSPSAVRRVLDKALTLDIAEKCGIPIPFTCMEELGYELTTRKGKLDRNTVLA